MYDLSVANIHGYVVNTSSAAVKNQISRLHLVSANGDPLLACPPEERFMEIPAEFCSTYLVNPEQSVPVRGSLPPYLYLPPTNCMA